MRDMRRVVIIGPSGSGKTTVAKKLSKALNIKATDLDDLHWRPGWELAERDEFRASVEAATSAQSWIISGNYKRIAAELIWPKADTLIWLDYGFMVNFGQLLSRTYKRVRDKKQICNGNYETLRLVLSKDSIILWFLRSYRERQRTASALFSDRPYDNIEHYLHINSRKRADELIASTNDHV